MIIFFILAAVFALLTLVSLVQGVWGMSEGDETRNRKANRLMQRRVIFQGLTLLMLALAVVTA